MTLTVRGLCSNVNVRVVCDTLTGGDVSVALTWWVVVGGVALYLHERKSLLVRE